ncbi:MAG: hypothetical protein JNL82_07555 [Myxococcales bacterium]|nr:hypothetical protein [Myxococcales bacterium]
MTNDKIELLRGRLGLDHRTFPDDARGVALPWASADLQPLVGDAWRSLGDAALPLEPGEATRDWTWARGDGRIKISVFVSSVGAAAARERLLMVATNSTMEDVPYVAGPADLGDVAAISPGRSGDSLIWAASNVCAWILVDDAPGVDAVAIARGLQALIDAHIVADVAAARPRIEAVKKSAREVEVDEWFTVTLRVRATAAELMVGFVGGEGAVRIDGAPGLTTTLRCEVAGPRVLTMMVADPSTLLSDSAPVTLLVKPAP